MEIVVSKSTREMCGDGFQFRILDLIRVKGKKKPVAIFELAAVAGGEPDECLLLYEQAFSAYQKRNFEEALKVLEEAGRAGINDKACNMLAGRCRMYCEAPPPEGWDGVETKKSK